MKIKVENKTWEEVLALPRPEHRKPKKPSRILSAVMRLASIPDLRDVKFSYTKKDMEKAGKGPWFILMNHASFLDLEIASKVLFPKRYQIVCTTDALVGKEWLMRNLGCIPTQKFVSDMTLISDIKHALTKNKTSVLMYPEAGYSFDGTATTLPRRMGVLLKALSVPVVMITTYGSFTRDPLYNNLQKRKLHVTAEMTCLLTPEEMKEKSVEEMDAILDQAFSFDYFRWQQENKIAITEPFRADGLHRIAYRCAFCGKEGHMEGKGTELLCHACGAVWELDEYGVLKEKKMPSSEENAPPSFPRKHIDHVPDWYTWEREGVREELLAHTYSLDTEVDIAVLIDYKALYRIGSGTLHHDENGFVLDGCDGKLHYTQKPTESHSLNADYFWYEIGDVICIGKKDCLYYCFPKEKDVVTKTRLAVEELYKLKRAEKKKGSSMTSEDTDS